MARFVHLADARLAARIRRGGLRTAGPEACVFCVPMTSDPSHALQWGRELRRGGYRQSVAVIFTLPDAEPVVARLYGQEGERMTAAQAVALFHATESPLGREVRIPRSIGRSELKAIRAVPRVAGWRYFPGAKHRQPFWPSPGERNAARLRRSINATCEALAREADKG